MTEGTDDEVLFERRGALGLVTLNRPKALNALSIGMIGLMRARLRDWAEDPGITRVALRGVGGRAFCAGGDVRAIHAAAKAGRDAEMFAIWRGEYDLVAALGRYPKPVVSLIDGLVMGGGAGISTHGPFRVASESYAFAMPEVAIGFVPDVGMTHVLPRLPHRAGVYLALTGARIGPGDAAALGLATHHAPAGSFGAILDGLGEGGAVADVLDAHAREPRPGPLMREAAGLAAWFSGGTVREILTALDAAGSDLAAEAARAIRSRSPTSLCLALEQMRRGTAMDLSEAIATEYRLVTRLMRGHDFHEGVRAVLIDKDGRPAWRPAALEDVDAAAVAAAFAPIAEGDPAFGD